MKKGWEIKKWNEVLEIRSGRNQTEVECEKGEYPILGSAGKVMGYAKKYISDEGSILIGRKGTIDNPLFIPYKYWNVDTAFGIHSLESIDNRFLYYFCKNYDFTKEDKGSGRPSLVKTDLLKIEMPVPPLSEQQDIVSILDDAFETIERAKSNAEQNLKNAKELFNVYLHKYFTNKEDGWEEKSLKDVAEYFNGLTYSPKNVSNEGMIVLRSSNIQEDKLDFKDIVRVDIKVKGKIIVRDGDILMCSRNGSQRLVGKTATINNLNEVMTFGTFMMIIRSEYNPYLIWFFKSTSFKNQISSGENTMINQITRYMLDDISLSFPPVKIQNEIVSQLDSLSDKIKKLESIYKQKLNDLEELKKSILQKAFNGELKTSKISA
jgi:type I restriction enzyme S subunit